MSFGMIAGGSAMDNHRLRLVPASPARKDQRVSQRLSLRLPGQLVWKDARGSTRLARIVTRDVSSHGIAVDCLDGGSIPLHRLVYVQLDRAVRETAEELPDALRRPAVLSAIYRVGPASQSTGTPETYALRLLVEPERASRPAKPAQNSSSEYERSA
jgi:hypothetical protein